MNPSSNRPGSASDPPRRNFVPVSPWRPLRSAEHTSVIRAETDEIVTYGAQIFIDPAPVQGGVLDALGPFEKVEPGDALRIRLSYTRVRRVSQLVIVFCAVDADRKPIRGTFRMTRLQGPINPAVHCVTTEARDSDSERAVAWEFAIGDSGSMSPITTRRGSAYGRQTRVWETAPLDPSRVEAGLELLSRELLSCALLDADVVATITTQQVVSGGQETRDSYSVLEVKPTPEGEAGLSVVQYFTDCTVATNEEVNREGE